MRISVKKYIFIFLKIIIKKGEKNENKSIRIVNLFFFKKKKKTGDPYGRGMGDAKKVREREREDIIVKLLHL